MTSYILKIMIYLKDKYKITSKEYVTVKDDIEYKQTFNLLV